MTSEHLLDAFGLIDDDLIADAEINCVSSYKSLSKQLRLWVPAAACVALLIATVPTLGRGGIESAFAPSSSDTALSGSAELSSQETADSITQDSSSGSSAEAILFPITVAGTEYSFSPQIDAPVLEVLPEGCLYLGQVKPYGSDADGEKFHTLFNTVYSGCHMWLEGEGKDSVLYLELPEGGYLLCRQR